LVEIAPVCHQTLLADFWERIHDFPALATDVARVLAEASTWSKEDIMSADAVIRLPDEEKGVVLRGQPMVFLVTGENTRHTSMFDWMIPAGFATGRHVHRVQEETFYLLEGECEWHVGDRTIRATPGTYLFIPPGVPHNITNVSEKPARVLMTVSPPGHEHYFEELAKLAAQGAPDPKALADLRNRYDTTQLSTLTTRA
jgi:quercetin dioxygenase-like cupin family protein